MQIAAQVLVLVHLIGFAALLGGVLAQARTPDPEVNVMMLYGALAELVSGVGLWIVLGLTDQTPAVAPLVVKSVLTALVTGLVVINRKYASIPRGLWALIGLMTLASTGIAVFWQ